MTQSAALRRRRSAGVGGPGGSGRGTHLEPPQPPGAERTAIWTMMVTLVCWVMIFLPPVLFYPDKHALTERVLHGCHLSG